jgi:hypothetical protein
MSGDDHSGADMSGGDMSGDDQSGAERLTTVKPYNNRMQHTLSDCTQLYCLYKPPGKWSEAPLVMPVMHESSDDRTDIPPEKGAHTHTCVLRLYGGVSSTIMNSGAVYFR